MSSNIPEYPHEPASSWSSGIHDGIAMAEEPAPSARQWAISVFLLGLTFLTTTFAGAFYAANVFGFRSTLRLWAQHPGFLWLSISFSFPLLAILLAHELGHYAACRYYGMRCTPPFFIPAPLPLTGTLGAFIKIQSPFRHKRALFDIGIAGPLAGFIFSLPVLWIGISISRVIPKSPYHGAMLSFGEPLLFQLMGAAMLGYSPARHDLLAHPMAMAGWIGLLATSLNLLPIWQLDGGHIAYAMLGRDRHRQFSIVMVLALIAVSFLGWPTPSYLLFGLLLLIIGLRARFYHPATLRDDVPLGTGRWLLGLLALLILILSFTPVPLSIL